MIFKYNLYQIVPLGAEHSGEGGGGRRSCTTLKNANTYKKYAFFTSDGCLLGSYNFFKEICGPTFFICNNSQNIQSIKKLKNLFR